MGKDDLDDFSDEDLPSTKDWVVEIVKTWIPAIFAVLFIRSAIAEPFRIPSGSMVPTLEIGDHILVTKYTYGFRIPLTRIPIGELKSPQRGDVIVFVYPGSDLDVPPYHFRDTMFTADKMEDVDKKISYWVDLPLMMFTAIDYVKRVVAIPGDRIRVIDNIVYINGKPQNKTNKQDYNFVNDSCLSYPMKSFTEDLEGYSHEILTKASGRGLGLDEIVVPEDHVFVMGDNRDNSSDSRKWGFVPFRNIKGKARFVWLSYNQCVKGTPLLGDIREDRFFEPIQ